ncbi:MAG: RHS repeat-associated core domain-containing protein [Filimonas sp.]|nr:RHS repeat-associated core domain-containing protein [Filimonas sp.]
MKHRIFLMLLSFVTVVDGIAQIKPDNATLPTATARPVPFPYSVSMPINNVKFYEALKPVSSESALKSGTLNETRKTVQYIDGLGRKIQDVAVQGSPGGKDIVWTTLYNEFGLEAYKYLPYVDPVATDGSFKLDPYGTQSVTLANYFPGENIYYSETVFDNSPLNTIKKSMAPGNSWTGSSRGVLRQQQVNSTNEVRLWTIGKGRAQKASSSGYYATGSLYRNITTDETGKRLVEYKNNAGRLVLKKVEIDHLGAADVTGSSGWLCTFYVYDELDRLRTVIPPKAWSQLSSLSGTIDLANYTSIFEGLCYYYEYDRRNRMLIKKLPGANEIWMLYDDNNRLICKHEGDYTSDEWQVYLYDDYDRLIQVGIGINDLPEFNVYDLQEYFGVLVPFDIETLQIEYYYDDYSWVSGTGMPGSFSTSETSTGFLSPSSSVFPYPMAITASSRTKNLITGRKVNILGTSDYLYTVNFYDDKERIIQTALKNISGGIDLETRQYSFSGQHLVSKMNHNAVGTTPTNVVVITKNTYSANGQLLEITKKVNSDPEVSIQRNEYNELGQLVNSKLGNDKVSGSYVTDPIEELNFDYNIRGWLTGINKSYATSYSTDHYFGEKISYDYGFNVPSGGYFNGNIAGVQWKSYNDNEQRAYGYKYDPSNRLLKADFTQLSGGNWDNSSGLDFSTKMGDGVDPASAYDANGNILYMENKAGSSALDQLTYSIDGVSNKVIAVTDASNNPSSTLGDFKEISSGQSQDYWYDNRGNMVKDENKGISNISYNILNLPDVITVTNKGQIEFTYDAMGTKLKKTVTDNTNSGIVTTTLYDAGFQYENNVLRQFFHETGRVRRKPDGSYVYDYFVKDHLGNTRVTLTEEQSVQLYRTATMEADSASVEERYYANLDKTRKPKPREYQPNDSANKFVAVVDGKVNKVGPSILLKVMAGDKVNIAVQSWYQHRGIRNKNVPVPFDIQAKELLSQSGVASFLSHGASGLTSGGIDQMIPAITSFLTTRDNNPSSLQSKPKAFLNWILLDEDLKPIKRDSTGIISPMAFEVQGFQQVGDETETKNHLKLGWKIQKTGFVYIFTSNQSPETPVVFDNFLVTTQSGHLLAVDHYYPFGLRIDGISSSAFGKLENNIRYNGKELQHKEFSDGNGLEWYDYGTRMYDAQIGRWHSIDPLSESMRRHGVYNYAYNNPIRFIDPDGMAPVYDWKKQKYMDGDKEVSFDEVKEYYDIQETEVETADSRDEATPDPTETKTLDKATEKKYRDPFYVPQPDEYADVMAVREKYRNLTAAKDQLEKAINELTSVIAEVQKQEQQKFFWKNLPVVVAGAVLAEADWPILMRGVQSLAVSTTAAYTELGILTYYRLQTVLATARLGVAQSLVTALGSSASLQAVNSVRAWGDKFTDPKKLLDQIKTLYDLYDKTKKMIE